MIGGGTDSSAARDQLVTVDTSIIGAGNFTAVADPTLNGPTGGSGSSSGAAAIKVVNDEITTTDSSPSAGAGDGKVSFSTDRLLLELLVEMEAESPPVPLPAPQQVVLVHRKSATRGRLTCLLRMAFPESLTLVSLIPLPCRHCCPIHSAFCLFSVPSYFAFWTRSSKNNIVTCCTHIQ